MDRLIITGGRKLEGRVRISGAKNAALAIVCASIMSNENVILENIPAIRDIYVLIEILDTIGVKVQWVDENSISIDASGPLAYEAPYDLVKKLRASNLLIGPLLAKCKKARVSLPGGCNIGSRPMDLHFKGFLALGAEIDLDQGFISASCSKLKGDKVYLDFPSVGATENIMMAACLAQGQTVIGNAAKEPEIVDLANFLNSLGAKVRGAGTDLIKIEGVQELGGGRHSVIPDRIEAGTFMVAAAASKGHVVLENVIQQHLEPLIAKLREANLEVTEDGDLLTVRYRGQFKAIDIKTMPYPGFPTDMQSQFISLLSAVPGTSIVIENVFENRFQVADELKRMGSKIKTEGRMAIIEGVTKLQGAHVKATDLRAGAALVIAGLMAEGDTTVSNVHYIDRGYDDLENKMVSLGANIARISD